VYAQTKYTHTHRCVPVRVAWCVGGGRGYFIMIHIYNNMRVLGRRRITDRFRLTSLTSISRGPTQVPYSTPCSISSSTSSTCHLPCVYSVSVCGVRSRILVALLSHLLVPPHRNLTVSLTLWATAGAYTTFAMCGFVRQNGAGDAALTRLWDEKQRGELRGQ
jgi:hypothetical protein